MPGGAPAASNYYIIKQIVIIKEKNTRFSLFNLLFQQFLICDFSLNTITLFKLTTLQRIYWKEDCCLT